MESITQSGDGRHKLSAMADYGYVKENGVLTFTPTDVKKSQQDQKISIFIKPQVRESEEEGEMVGRGLRVTRGIGCHLQLTGRLLEPTPTACLLANTLISWRGFWTQES